MDRRDFIKKGALGASGVVGLSRPTPGVASPVDMTAYVERVDTGMARISQWSLADSFPEFTGDPDLLDTLGRKSMQTLYMTGMFGDLPVESQLDVHMQARMWDAQPVMDESLIEMTDFLSRQTPEHLERVRSTLRARPEVLRNISRTLDEEAARSGVSEPRRAQLSKMFGDVGWRMEHQPPPLIVNEYLDKTERVSASDIESEVHQRWMAARLGEKVFWQAEASLRDRRISRGLRAMGIGVLLFGAGALLVSLDAGDVVTAIGLVPGITAGSIFFVVGVIILVVGLTTSDDAT